MKITLSENFVAANRCYLVARNILPQKFFRNSRVAKLGILALVTPLLVEKKSNYTFWVILVWDFIVLIVVTTLTNVIVFLGLQNTNSMTCRRMVLKTNVGRFFSFLSISGMSKLEKCEIVFSLKNSVKIKIFSDSVYFSIRT